MSKPELSDPITLRVPLDILKAVESIGETCERSRSWVIIRALKLYLASEGGEILAVRRGRGEIAAGQSHEMDDVIGEIEAIVAGKAA